MHLARGAFDDWEVGVAWSPLWHLACLWACTLALAALQARQNPPSASVCAVPSPSCGALRWGCRRCTWGCRAEAGCR